MENYIENLKEEIKLKDIDEEYGNLCIEYATRLIDNNLPVIFDKEHLSFLLGIKIDYINKLVLCTNKFYKKYYVRKKSGGKRTISVPNARLKYIQRWILDNVIYNIRVSDNVNGFIPNKSIVDNAKVHIGSDVILTIDIRNFFPSINFQQVFKLFYYYGYTKEISYYLSRLCTLDETLPQGAPTSPYLANILCRKMDKRLSLLCCKIKAKYTRYADDITISGNKNIVNYIEVINKIVSDEGFHINSNKTRIMYKNRQQRVTGLVVNDKVSVPNDKIKYLRQQIYFINKYGVTSHVKRSKFKGGNIKEHLYGLAYFIKMVDIYKGKKFLEELNLINWDS